MGPRSKRDVTDAELAVLRELWQRDAATIRELVDRLYPGGGASEYGTVQKLLDRLAAKGYVRRHRKQVPHVFVVAVSQTDLIARRLEALADELCEGSLAPLLTNLVGQRALTDPERRALRELVEQLDRKGKKRS